MYLAVALFFITNLFSLYRLSRSLVHLYEIFGLSLDWWPSVLGGRISYALNWSIVLALGLAAHDLDLFHLRNRWQNRDPHDEVDWERKSGLLVPYEVSMRPLTVVAFWVLLSFAAMLMPALACFSKLKRDKRHKYRHTESSVSRTSVLGSC